MGVVLMSKRELNRIDVLARLDGGRLTTAAARSCFGCIGKKTERTAAGGSEIARQPAGPPMVLTPLASPPTAAKRPVDRSKSSRCEDGSLSCSWKKFSAALRNAFASSSKPKP
jgi:hypothetical protein